jgi:hypothetical protein
MSGMDELERELSARCREMRDGAEALLEALEHTPTLFTPAEAAAARRLATSTLAAVEEYEREHAADMKKPAGG